MENVHKVLTTFNRKTINLAELEEMLTPFSHTYECFAKIVLTLEEEGILLMMKTKGRTNRTPSLAFQYRINKSRLARDHHHELQQYRRTLHPAINLDNYYSLEPTIWKNDLPYLTKIDKYLKKCAFPKDLVPAPERSFELVGDEKWLVEKGGKALLEKIGLYDKFHICPVSEPLMFAISPDKINEPVQRHLIVENKTTYQGLLPALKDSNFSTLIYGCGKAVIKSIEQFTMQYPVEANHHFYYFGDIDLEGISIWSSLNERQPASIALPFYLACLEKEPAKGKEYQRERTMALEGFLKALPQGNKEQIRSLFNSGYYYPQEILTSIELQAIWREADWT